ELEKLNPERNGYRKFMLKAKKTGSGELTFQAGNEVIKVKVLVEDDYTALENELNKLFGLTDPSEDERIKVVSANLVNNKIEGADNAGAHIYLHGTVESSKKAMLAVAFAANAIGDHGVKIFSNPGGQLRMEDLGLSQAPAQTSSNNNEDGSFVEFYESTNKLIDTNNLYRDLILCSENEKVVSYIQIQEPKRFAVKVRFLEMDSKFADEFINSLNTTVTGGDVRGSFGSNDIASGSVSKVSDLITTVFMDSFSGLRDRLTNNIDGGNLVSGSAKLYKNAAINFRLNDLLQEGVLRVMNEFSLITHSGELVSLGKGTRFPIPKQNNGLGNTAITFEYIPIGFKGELKVTGLENQLIDVQLASRLSAAEATVATVQGISIPVFSEEYVNSGALLKNGQEVILNAFMTESETLAKSTSPLGRIIPFWGRSKRKRKNKNILFISLSAQEIAQSSKQIASANVDLPHLDMNKGKHIYSDYNRKLRKNGVTDTVDLAGINQSNKAIKPNNLGLDPLKMEGLEF
ncbi:MAG: hypothetical protein OXU45_03730, partial [Candidatus Melainabacteria bacterium]|nr:hypothetical protein [Candidatus Melainabacteria bacterium]